MRTLMRWTIRNPRRLLMLSIALIILGADAFAGFLMALPVFLSMVIVAQLPVAGFEASLPVHGRTLVASRVLVLSLLILVPLSVWAVWTSMRGIELEMGRTVWDALGVATFMILTPELARGGAASASFRPQLVAWTGFLVVSAALMLVPVPAVRAGLALLLVVAVLILLWRRIPEAVLIAPLVSGSRAERGVVPRESRRGALRSLPVGAGDVGGALTWRDWWLLTHIVAVPSRWYFWLLLTGFVAFSQAWTLALYFVLAAQMLPAALHWLYPLPLYARARLHLLLLLGPIGMSVMIALGANFSSEDLMNMNHLSAGAPYADEPGAWFDNPTEVPLAFWERAPATGESRGQAPRIVAPWGERVQPFTLPVAGFLFYNPYSTRRASSAQFIDWQVSRATQAVYGRAISRTEEKRGQRPRRLTRSLRMQVLMGAACLTYAMLAFWMVLYTRHVASRWSARGRVIGEWLSILPVYLLFGAELTWGLRSGTHIVVPLLQYLMLHLSDALNHSLPLIAVVAALPVSAAYWALRWLYPKIEPMPVTVAAKY